MRTAFVNQSAPCQCGRCNRPAAPATATLAQEVENELAKHPGVVAYVDEEAGTVATYMAVRPYYENKK